MGVNSCGSLLSSAKDVKMNVLANFLKSDRGFLVADIDIRWLVFKIANGKDDSAACKEVANFLATLAFYGYTVNPICDGIERHRSKRALLVRIRKSEERRFSCVALRFEAMHISQQLTGDSDETRKKDMSRELSEKDKAIKTLQNESGSRVSCNFGQILHDYLCENDYYDPNKFAGMIKKVIISKFQADSIIGKRAIEKKSSIIFGSDSDFAVFLGPDYFAVSDFQFRRNQKGGSGFKFRIQSLKISVAALNFVEKIQNFDSKILFKIAKYHLFDDDCIRMRGMKALCIGTDVFLGGLKNFGVSKL